jgi:hypothetical protein
MDLLASVQWKTTPNGPPEGSGDASRRLFTFGEIVESAFEQLFSKLGYLEIHWTTGTFAKCVDPASACPSQADAGKRIPAGVTSRDPGPDVGRWGDIEDARSLVD